MEDDRDKRALEDLDDAMSRMDLGSGRLISNEEFLSVTKDVFKDKLKISLDEQANEYKKRIGELERLVKLYKPKKNEVAFPNGWDADIKQIKLHLYIIVSRMESEPVLSQEGDLQFLEDGTLYTKRKGECAICNAFKELGMVESLEKVWERINIPREKFTFKIWNIDQIDRKVTQRDDPNYSDKLSTRGVHWFYARGRMIRYFPAIELWTVMNPLSKRNKDTNQLVKVQGLGDNPNDPKFSLLEDSIINYYQGYIKKKKFNERNLQEMGRRVKGKPKFRDVGNKIN